MPREIIVTLPTLHPGQIKAFRATRPSERQLGLDPAFAENSGGRFKAIRCGRRWGKSLMGETWLSDGAIKGYPNAIFAPDYKKISEIYQDIYDILKPVISRSSKTAGVIRTITGGRIDFWTLENDSAGRSRKYKRVFIDESAFTKPNMLDVWARSIKPTLLDLSGECITASNTNGIDPNNFLYAICNDPKHGFIEFHAPSIDNPLVPERMKGESESDHIARRLAEFAAIRAKEHPLVWRQEYEADFVDWGGVAFFSIDKWLDEMGRPTPMPAHCDRVFAVVDSAVKTGSANDGTAVIYLARNQYTGIPLVILDWDIIQVESDLLTTWLPKVVLPRLDELAKQTGAREGSRGVWIEDRSSGQTLLQHGKRQGWPVHAIDSKFTSLGKDERAIAVSGHHHQGLIKIAEFAHNKTSSYKGTTRNHLETQVAGFRIGDKDAARRADDLLDAYAYSVSLALGNNKGY